MKILHTISGMNYSAGGPSLSVWTLVNGLRALNINAELVTFNLDRNDDKIIGEGSFLHTLPAPNYHRFAYSSAFNSFFKNSSYDIYHGQGLWQYPVHAMARVAHKRNIPYIISPRGMLYDEAMKKNEILKKIALSLFQRLDLKRASVIHATCLKEYDHIREMGFKNPIAIIPNAIPVEIPKILGNKIKQKRQVGFIGRFDPIKNIELLITAWSEIGENQNEWELVLIGDGKSKYKNEIFQLAKNLNINNIRFTGFLVGKDKEDALQSLDYLILPSKSENFGMVVAEALVRGIPVIASKGTPWEDLNTHNAGWWIEPTHNSVKETLITAIHLTKEKKQIMESNARNLIINNYNPEVIVNRFIELYLWILNKGKKPNFVHLS